ncbi:UNVERIFIED_ORG: glutamate-ammonia-ligase adenylyltransferase [Methylobacterium sp. SuP10 SLI 274]|uniref:bifunctional [glutamine synthetase] adenylyltransferase/[glutamine synthetase]-adenylyl-L-tyrosine phosphorylase n=1 Tax=Methylorubrum extorquens TaxID=408 RepID=UPI0020A02370|nr:bifunctional [glutamine synthetase] adenylyltransferase/[glutamine synthetase]-adenylyl-L-tyrosine phosphorylase [Methylorubrum extorquens]MDF9862251.1 glutamate-ammonia-ligase adenylyltransferase [Methylorubrum pseudosasae]MDH6635871.1 glutamate-ammonia-ligase adenylyltransferase [Methylobacterium sp. SuP10 SLI 274]MDH6665044.1 glutamate-ammonia-ligase adenylyltransferase [Methylorubrum zatmanii]MCP1556972.1 glutamate-ammonia-ligase adenylyltransferase [Methylorubrum extorquens]MDF9790550.
MGRRHDGQIARDDGTVPLIARLGQAPPLSNPEAAQARLDEIADALPNALREGPARDLLAALADHSTFLWSLASRDPARLVRLFEEAPEAADARIIAAQRAAGRAGEGAAPDLDAVGKTLRRNRAEHALLVALADIGGLWPLERVTAALSDFADASVSAAVDAMLLQAAAAGRFLPKDAGEPQAGSGLVVLGLGKLGGRELNYSSDIDVIVFFDPETVPLKPGLEPTPFFTKLAQGVSKLLQERTRDGYVHRVDYRLRPDPGSTPTAMSLASAYVYYETTGQNWERAAFIKARAIAGDIPAGERFLADLTPFVWRKYFDFAAIADVHAMKRQIHAVRGHEALAVAGHDIKLGRGGIREIEFFVQTQQLVFGGRRPMLRGRSTVPMLAKLHEDGWISAEARDELGAAYAFLRTVEHRLQMVRDEQTQRLPTDRTELENFARFAGFTDLAGFEAALLAHARRVQAHYALLFEAGPDLSSEVGDLVFSGAADDPATLATLRSLGFRDPERVTDTVRGWHFGRRAAVRSPRAREVLTELVPALLKALSGTPDPDAALANLDRAFGRMPAAVELLTILREHERLRLLFADLLGSAPRLAGTVAFSPHVLDAVIDPDFGDPSVDAGAIAAHYRALLGRPDSHEVFLDRSRDAARQLRFLTGARLLSGILTPQAAGCAFSAIADAAVATALDAVSKTFFADHGPIPNGRIVVLGYGRLGSHQLTAESDLDLVVLYDFDPENRTSTGPKPLDAAVAYNRLTQRLVAALTAPTRRGLLYEVDLRLRPGGGQGAAAAQFRSFRAYQREEAELWEHMALTRARVIAGDESLAEEAKATIRDALMQPRGADTVNRSVRSMRATVENEKGDHGPLDLKLSPGGLLDLDFLAQALVLGHAHTHPDLIGLDAPEVFSRAAEGGIIAADEAEPLADAYRLLDDVHQWQRLMVEGDPTQASDVALARLARAANLPDAKALSARLDEERRTVRTIFDRRLGRPSGG